MNPVIINTAVWDGKAEGEKNSEFAVEGGRPVVGHTIPACKYPQITGFRLAPQMPKQSWPAPQGAAKNRFLRIAHPGDHA